MKNLYHAYAKYIDGSTDEVIKVYINCADSQKRAKELCEEYAKTKKGIMQTWIIKQGRKNEYCVKSYV